MVLREAREHLGGWDVKLLATDLDSAVLATAAAGVYDSTRLSGMSPDRLARFFERGVAAQAGRVRVLPGLRELITFRQLNLMHEWPMRGPFDAIFCRNVIIYFDRPTQVRLLEKLTRQLAPGGYFFAGHSESLQGMDLPLVPVAPSVYRKP
jgi:chemotaxis protein methyltransferase CheR